jgi:hypothetical protein
MTSLPSEFVLYIPSRRALTDPFSGFIVVDCTKSLTDTYTIKQRRIYSKYNVLKHPCEHARMKGIFPFYTNDDQVVPKYVSDWSKRFTITNIEGKVLEVLGVDKHSNLFSRIPKRNMCFKAISHKIYPTITDENIIAHSGTQDSSTAATPPSSTAASSAAAVSSSAAVSSKKYTSYNKTSLIQSLPLFVATQLLELAKLRCEVCPITLEPLKEGNTAVMTCGHMFTHLAIHESFKHDKNICPSCRATGLPMYV